MSEPDRAPPSAAVEPQAPEAPPEALIVVSNRAAAKINEIRGEEKVDDSDALRLSVRGGGCSGFSYDLSFDKKGDVDHLFESNGVRIVCDEMSLMYLVGAEIDYVEELQGAGFKFTNPNVKSTCGCGSSFSV